MHALISLRIILFFFGLSFVLHSPAIAQGIGFSEWFQPDVTVQPQGSGRADLMTKNRAFLLNDLLNTSRVGAADITFVQGQKLLVGPDCEVVLDSRIYDPNARSVSLEIYSRKVCVTRAGAGELTIILRTPIATVTLKQADAVIEYDARPGASTSPSVPSPSPSPSPISPVQATGATQNDQRQGDRAGGPGSLTIISETISDIGNIVVEPLGEGGQVMMLAAGQMITLGTGSNQSSLVNADPKALANALKGLEIADIAGSGGTLSSLEIDLGELPQSLPDAITSFDLDRFNPCAFGDFCDRIVVCFENSPGDNCP